MTADLIYGWRPCPIHRYIRFAAGIISRICRSVEVSTDPSVADRAYLNIQAGRYLDEYGGSILRLAYTYLHNTCDSEDVLQDTLVQYLKTAPVFETAVHEKAWLLRVAANLSKNRIKYNRLRSTDELDEKLAAEEREDLSFVWEAVRSLLDRQREAVHLFYYESYTTSQIAEILERKESTVRSDLRRGRTRLRGILKGEYDFEEI